MNIILILICVCFSLSFSLAVILISRPRQRMAKFFEQMEFRGKGDQKIPRCIGREQVSEYVEKIRFKSAIPLREWEKIWGDLELFYKQRIHKMKQSKEKINVMEIYVEKKPLPTFIEWSDEFMEHGPRFAIGEGYMGKVVWDTAVHPHGLIGGSSGSGKTSTQYSIAYQAISKKWNVNILEFKGGGDYIALEQGYGPIIISDPIEARDLLLALTIEAKGRMAVCKEAGVSKIEEYNDSGRGYFVPWLLVVDEAAELFDVKPKSKEEKELYTEIDSLFRILARTARASGIHILMSFIRPSSDVLDGQIKNTLSWRVCGYFPDPAASRIVLDNDRATELPSEIKGRFIVGDEEVQAYYMPIRKPATEV